ncbi:MAG TPA: nucleotidyltransferase family protein [Chloroflexia bacterium]|nr:nucleotidyltransferase family protein [Chloroflexia bacterium]
MHLRLAASPTRPVRESGAPGRGLAAQLCCLTGARPIAPAALAAWLAGRSPEDWDRILDGAHRARLVAQVAAHLDVADVMAVVPPFVQQTLYRARRDMLVRFVQQAGALERIAAALQPVGIPFRVLKGLALAADVYPVPAARAVGDIDLWVRPRDLERTRDLLSRLDLTAMPDAHGRPLAFLAAFAEEQEFVPRPGGAVPAYVDLHWHPVAPWWMRATLRIPEAALFAGRHPVLIAGRTYATLTPTDHLYYLCLHSAIHHQFQGLRPLVDMAFLVQSGRVDWVRLAHLAQSSGSSVILWRCLELLDAALGTQYRTWCTPPPARWHRRLLRCLMPPTFTEGLRAPNSAAGLGIPREQLLLLPHPGAMAAALAQLLWPPAAWIRLRYAPLPAGGVFGARARHIARLRHLARGRSPFSRPT